MPGIASVKQDGRQLLVEWDNGESSRFHHVWLRDCCYCEVCGDCFSSLRRYLPRIEHLDSFPAQFDWTEQELEIVWAEENHHSKYTASWLYTNRYDDAARAARRPALSYWNATTGIGELTHDFQRVNHDKRVRHDLQRQLITHGMVVVRGGPAKAGGVLAFAELLGEVADSAYGAIFDLKPGNAIGTAGTTLRAVPPHSDEAFAYAPPGIEVLACVNPASDGGDSVMVDGIGIAQQLREQHPRDFELLASWNHHYIRLHPGQLDQRAHMPVITLDDDGEVAGIRLHTRASGPLDLPETIMEDYLVAYHRLCELMMSAENQVHLRLEAGDAIIFDNHRALHARSEFSDRQRHMQICAVTREKFHESFRLLAAEVGDMEATNLVLRAGAYR